MLSVALDKACVATCAAHASAFESCLALEGSVFQEIAHGAFHARAGEGLAETLALGGLRRHVREEVGDEAGGCPVRRREAAAVVEVQSLDIKPFRAPKGFEDADAFPEGREILAVARLVAQSDGLQQGVGKEVDTFMVSLIDDAGEGRGIGGDESRPLTRFRFPFFAEKAVSRGREGDGDAQFLQFPGEIAGEKQRRVRQVSLYRVLFSPCGNHAVEESLVGERGSHDVAAIRADGRGA